MGVSFIHTADWQIGRRFTAMAEEPGVVLSRQRIETVREIARLARQSDVDAVLVAGDIFDTNTVRDETIHRLLHALEDFKGPWVLLPGNHDAALAESVWTRMARFGAPDNVILATIPEPIVLASGRLVVFPAPLQRRHEMADLTVWFDGATTADGAVRVGLAHGSVTGRLPEGAELHNPIADTRAETARLDYLALGDWHGTLAIARRTWYAGTPEPDRFKDNDPGNILHVQIRGPGSEPVVEKVAVARYRWFATRLAVRGAADVAAVDALFEGLGDHPQDHVVALRLEGTVDLATRRTLQERIDVWRGRLLGLDVDDSGLIAEPSEDDLDRIDQDGFVRTAVDRLRARAADGADPERDLARLALQILYLEHVRGRG